MSADWTDDRVEAMRVMWLDAKSMSQMAAALGGGITRNAVIGKIHRLGWAKSSEARARTSAETDKSSRPKAPRAAPVGRSVPVSRLSNRQRMSAALPASRPVPIEPPKMPETEHFGAFAILAIKEDGHGTCKYPVGDPSTHDFRFCGAERIAGTDRQGSPYCSFHHRMSYQPGSAERRRRVEHEPARRAYAVA